MEYIQIVAAGPSAMARALRQYVEPPTAVTADGPVPLPAVVPGEMVETAAEAGETPLPEDEVPALPPTPPPAYLHNTLFPITDAGTLEPDRATRPAAPKRRKARVGAAHALAMLLLIGAAFYGAYVLLEFLGFESPLAAFGL